MVAGILALVLVGPPLSGWPAPGAATSHDPPISGAVQSIPLLPARYASGLPVTGSAGNPETLASARDLAVTPELYNLASAGGTTVINETAGGGLAARVNLSDIQPRTPGIVGYPGVRYGYNPFCGNPDSVACRTHTETALPLPSPVDRLPPLVATVQYQVAPPGRSGASVDLAFDLWLTAAPWSDRAHPGDIEVMVWLYHSAPTILPAGASSSADTPVYLPVESRGQWSPQPFLWATGVGSGGWRVVYLIDASNAPAATVGVSLSRAIEAAPALLGLSAVLGPSVGSLYLEGVDLGSEFRAAGPGGSVAYAWGLDSFSLGVGAPSSTPSPGVSGAAAGDPVVVAPVPVLRAPGRALPG